MKLYVTTFFAAIVVALSLIGAANANGTICIAGKCTTDSHVGSLSVQSDGNTWNCQGVGCASFEQDNEAPLHNPQPTTPSLSYLPRPSHCRKLNLNGKKWCTSVGKNGNTETIRYVIQPGDTFAGVLTRLGFKKKELNKVLQDYRDSGKNPDIIRAGQEMTMEVIETY